MKRAALLLSLSLSLLASSSLASESVLFSFKQPQYGYPTGRLLFDGKSLVGTGGGDGATGDYGQVFALSNHAGVWKEKQLLVFNGTNGSEPPAGLIRDAAGALYGTTSVGGLYSHGVAFKLSKSGSQWTGVTLWNFGNGSDGAEPLSDLTIDSAGTLYGTTLNGGANGLGTVFTITPGVTGFNETAIHDFAGGGDGKHPRAGLLLDKSGALFGVARDGGTNGGGTAFELSHSSGVWTETTLYNFGGRGDGATPDGRLVEDKRGTLYGTTRFGGVSGHGTVFQLRPIRGVWIERVLYTFTGSTDGAYPVAGLGISAGTLLGTTEQGGNPGCDNNLGCGVVFKLLPSASGWTETVLHPFDGTGGDGTEPFGGVIVDKNGNLYGTTVLGGAYGNGAVYKITP